LVQKKNSLSVCTAQHAKQTAKELEKTIETMKKGKNAVFLVGTGHSQATCQVMILSCRENLV